MQLVTSQRAVKISERTEGCIHRLHATVKLCRGCFCITMRAREFFVLGSGLRTGAENGEAANREKGDALPDCLLIEVAQT